MEYFWSSLILEKTLRHQVCIIIVACKDVDDDCLIRSWHSVRKHQEQQHCCSSFSSIWLWQNVKNWYWTRDWDNKDVRWKKLEVFLCETPCILLLRSWQGSARLGVAPVPGLRHDEWSAGEQGGGQALLCERGDIRSSGRTLPHHWSHHTRGHGSCVSHAGHRGHQPDQSHPLHHTGPRAGGRKYKVKKYFMLLNI